MRILVLSDTHGDFNRMMKAVTEQPTAEVIIHCGDGEQQVEYLKQNFKDKMVVGVRALRLGQYVACDRNLENKRKDNFYNPRSFV